MVVDNRIYQVLGAIVNNPNISGVELQSKFNLSRKQLSYTFKKINDFLESNNFVPIKRFKTGRFSVDKIVVETFRQTDEPIASSRYLYSEEERVSLVILALLTRTERLSLIHLSSSLVVSQNTIINDMKKVQELAEKYYLQVSYDRESGYRLIGGEIDKRHLLLKIIRKIVKMPIAKKIFFESGILTPGRLEQVGSIFGEIEKKLKILFTDEQLQELIYFICFILHRIETNKTVDNLPVSYQEVVNSSDFSLMQKLIERLGIYAKNEQIFLTALVQSSNIQTITDGYFHFDNVLLTSVIDVINNFEQISCITFKDKEELINRIYQHWKPAYYRIRYHINNINSVYDIVLQEFGHLHEMVRRAIDPFEKLIHSQMPDEEVAFITVLFGGWLTREGIINQIKTKKIAIVVCENSATVSTYLYLTLQVLFPELHFAAVISKREFEKYQRYYDIIFSTSHLDTNKILFIINPSLRYFHKNAFRNQVISTLQGVDPRIIQIEDLIKIIEQYSQITNKKSLQVDLTKYIYHDELHEQKFHLMRLDKPSLADLLRCDHITLASTADIVWDKAIELAAAPLLAKHFIEPIYVQNMIEKIRLEQPYIMLVEGLIITHASIGDGVNQICMSLLKLPEKIDIDGYMQADLIVVLATNNCQKHLQALAQLNEFLEFHHGAEKLRHARSCNEIYQLFFQYQ